ncbi:hypothetical protein HUB98_09945 [Paenibacillus barcinonensis]|uniref:Uncharacterized protein n=1 Tax=Paenibacillus barcinonensis TaxID=198119 RepID=A0A2V4W4S0_PAEBA|nr:hypothetical protein [Paenibacillus barcinonensis]PYE49666.1 hypothetical protein DFQ00_105170 [Paenibacillus barcinonensis]QKS56628.1 hypothetical protein HUB98_09945 [Paenibacillus barcinonensis]
MLLKKSLKVLSLVTVLSLSLAIPVLASDSETTVNNRAPIEEYKDGKLFIDGVQLLTEKDLKDNFRKNLKPVTIPNSGGIGTMGRNSWTKVAEANFYTSYDRDRYNNVAAGAVKRTLSTKSEFTISVSGETSFGFKDVVGFKLAGAIGQKFEKSLVETYTIPAGWVYEQKSAIKVTQEDYRYTDVGIIWDTQYNASTFDYRGFETWLWSNPIN